jgi:hypothetical protein
MGSSSGGQQQQQQPTNQTITQTDLPEYARPYYEDLMTRAQGESNRPYEPYGEQRIADFTGMQRNAQDATGMLQRPGQYGAATDMAHQAGLQALGTQWTPGTYDSSGAYTGADPYQFSGYQEQSYRGANPYQSQTYQQGPAYDTSQNQFQQGEGYEGNTFDNRSWTASGTADQFMSPYQQHAVDVQKDEAIRDAQKGVLAQNLDASRQGTYGGSRQLLAQMERERNLGDELSQIQAAGSQHAYDRGQQAFEQEQNRYQNTQQMGEQSGQFGANLGLGERQFAATHGAGQQQFGANLGQQDRQFGANIGQQDRQYGYGQGLQDSQFGANIGQQDRQFGANLDATQQQYGYGQGLQDSQFGAQFNEQQNQFGANFGENSAQFGANLANMNRGQALTASQGLGALGNMTQASDLARIQAQATAGAEMQDMNQQYMDQAYGDFLRQRDYPKEQLNFYNAQLRGVPVNQMASTATAYAPPPSLATQIGGAGLAGLGLYQNFRGDR